MDTISPAECAALGEVGMGDWPPVRELVDLILFPLIRTPDQGQSVPTHTCTNGTMSTHTPIEVQTDLHATHTHRERDSKKEIGVSQDKGRERKTKKQIWGKRLEERERVRETKEERERERGMV